MTSTSSPKIQYTLRKVGHPFTTSYHIYLESLPCHKPVSPFHDIPLHASHPSLQNASTQPSSPLYNMIVEIPRWSNAKFEISPRLPLNPITQDTLSSSSSSSSSPRPRFVPSIHPYTGYPFNYGALPQTWESPHHLTLDPTTGKSYKGDNDPLDAVEIGSAIAYSGEVKTVKILGILGLVDQGEMDWKLVTIDVRDDMAGKLDDVEDVEREMPGLLEGMRDWFRIYKVPEGGEANRYAFGGEVVGRREAERVVRECEGWWKGLVRGEVDGGDISLKNTTLEGTPGKVDPCELDLPPGEDSSPAPVEDDLEKWYFVNREKLNSRADASLGQCSVNIILDLK